MKAKKLIRKLMISVPILATPIWVAACGMPGGGRFGSFNKLSPYMDVYVNNTKRGVPTLVQHHVKSVTLAFIQKKADDLSQDIPAWGAIQKLDQDVEINGWISQFKKVGGDVAISFGGAANDPVWYQATEAQAYSAINEVYQKYHPERLDFDIEGSIGTDKNSVGTLVSALNRFNSANPTVPISFTLAADPGGFGNTFVSTGALNVFNNLNFLPIINIMAMDYGSWIVGQNPNMWKCTLETIKKTSEQLTTAFAHFHISSNAWIGSHYGITPMIGHNDTAGQIWTFDDTKKLTSYAKANHLALLSYWSITRDFPNKWGGATGSGMENQTNFQYFDTFYNGLW